MERTFPIDRQELTKRRWSTVLGSVLTWASPLPAFAAWAFLGLSGWVAGGLFLATGAGLTAWWKKKLPQLEKGWIAELRDKSNEGQNKLLARRAREFQEAGQKLQSEALFQVLTFKQDIETRVHQSALTQSHKERLDSLVDTISFALIDKLEQCVHHPSPALQTEIDQAINTLKETHRNLPDILNPASEVAALPGDSLQSAINELRDEAIVAQKVKQRLMEDWGQSLNTSETTYSSQASVRD